MHKKKEDRSCCCLSAGRGGAGGGAGISRLCSYVVSPASTYLSVAIIAQSVLCEIVQ